jgi:inosine-uridine nucleoside N-ribohydrolase
MEYKHKYTRLTYAYITYAVAIICGLSLLSSCTSDNDDNPGKPGYDGVPLVILDTDIGSSTDDLFAMEMLYRYMDEGRCKLLGVVVNRMGDDYAALADVMNTYFGHGSIPIGMERGGIKNPSVFIDYRNLYKHTTETGELMFKRTLSDYSQLPNGWELYRRLLASQPDHSVSICSTGFVSSLVQLLVSEPDDISPLSGVELVSQKVKCLYLMAGVFTSSEEPDYNFLQDPTYAKLLFEHWPRSVDVVFSPMEVGNEIEYRPETVISDISWTDIHPIKEVYKKYNCDTGQKMWDPMAVIQAVEGDEVFTLSERGIVTLTPNAGTIFTPSATGNHRYQKPGTQEWCQAMLEKIRKSLLQSRRE